MDPPALAQQCHPEALKRDTQQEPGVPGRSPRDQQEDNNESPTAAAAGAELGTSEAPPAAPHPTVLTRREALLFREATSLQGNDLPSKKRFSLQGGDLPSGKRFSFREATFL